MKLGETGARSNSKGERGAWRKSEDRVTRGPKEFPKQPSECSGLTEWDFGV